jgi:hypothetical protein
MRVATEGSGNGPSGVSGLQVLSLDLYNEKIASSGLSGTGRTPRFALPLPLNDFLWHWVSGPP